MKYHRVNSLNLVVSIRRNWWFYFEWTEYIEISGIIQRCSLLRTNHAFNSSYLMNRLNRILDKRVLTVFSIDINNFDALLSKLISLLNCLSLCISWVQPRFLVGSVVAHCCVFCIVFCRSLFVSLLNISLYIRLFLKAILVF
jgi:hypothetical protein